jgi:tetratricopeptide (TPR) repeat protein
VPSRFFLPIIISLLLSLAIVPLFAQANPTTFPFRQRVVFVPNPNAEEKITNDLLQHIADGSGRLRSMVAYTIEGRLNLYLQPNGNGRIIGTILLESFSVNGDMHYRDFSLGKVLDPDLLRFEVVVKNTEGRIVYSESPSQLPVKEAGSVVYGFETTRKNANGELQATVSNIHFSYSEAAYQRLDQWFGYLEEYYSAGARLNEIQNELKVLDFADPTKLILGEFALCEAERQLALISQQGFLKGLDGATGDPEGVFLRYNEVVNRTGILRSTFNNRMAVIDSLLYDSGRTFFQMGQLNAARDRFENSLMLSPFFIPSHLALAELDLLQGRKELSINRLGGVFSKMFPSGEWRHLALALTDSVMTAYFREAFNLNREGRFKESLDLMAPLEAFCETTDGFIDCPFELEFRLNQSHMGMYRSFLVVGGRALRNNNLNLCRIYTTSAVEYQRNNQRFIPDASEAFDVLQQTVNRHLELAASHFSNKEYLRSSESFASAIELCNQYNELFCPANLDRRHQLALEMHERREIATPTAATVHADPETIILPPLLGQPREELLEKIQFGQLQAWAGNLQAAREMQEEAVRISRIFRLSNDIAIQGEMQKLVQQIKGKECELTARELSALLILGLNYKQFGEISLAVQTGETIQDLLKAHPHCLLQPGDSLEWLINLAPAAAYLELIKDAQRTFNPSEPGQYQNTFEKFHLTEIFFIENNLDSQKTPYTSLQNFISGTRDLEIIKAGIAFMAGHASTYENDIIPLFLILKEAGLTRNETRSLQDLAGRKLASHYHRKNPGQQPEPLVQSLTGRDNWFRFFDQAFIRYWGIY